MRKVWAEYKDFINQGNVITIAVGLVMALFFKDIIDAVVDAVIMPIISLVTGQRSFDEIDFAINKTTFEIGLVVRALIIFLIVAFVLYLIVKLYNTYIVRPDPDIVAETELSVLAEIRDEMRASRLSGGVGGGAPPPPTI